MKCCVRYFLRTELWIESCTKVVTFDITTKIVLQGVPPEQTDALDIEMSSDISKTLVKNGNDTYMATDRRNTYKLYLFYDILSPKLRNRQHFPDGRNVFFSDETSRLSVLYSIKSFVLLHHHFLYNLTKLVTRQRFFRKSLSKKEFERFKNYSQCFQKTSKTLELCVQWSFKLVLK